MRQAAATETQSSTHRVTEQKQQAQAVGLRLRKLPAHHRQQLLKLQQSMQHTVQFLLGKDAVMLCVRVTPVVGGPSTALARFSNPCAARHPARATPLPYSVSHPRC